MAKAPEVPSGSRLSCAELDAPYGLTLGEDVIVECDHLRAGRNVSIGARTEANFRVAGGARIKVDMLVLEDEACIGRGVQIQGGAIHLGQRVQLSDETKIHAMGRLRIGAGGTVGQRSEITGVDIDIGRRLWMLSESKIGGGSALESPSRLRIGDFAHLGMYTFINTARAVDIGDEVGLGTHTSLYTHGAWPSVLCGGPASFAPISIGDRSWLPGAIVNPGVTIGADVVVAVGSVVTRDLPSGCLAGGGPARVLREHAYPRALSPEERAAALWQVLETLAEIVADQHEVVVNPEKRTLALDDRLLVVSRPLIDSGVLAELGAERFPRQILLAEEFDIRGNMPAATQVDIGRLALEGVADSLSERLVNQFRRYGVRFRYEADGGRYRPWPEDPMRLTE